VEASTATFSFARLANQHGAQVHVVHAHGMRNLYDTGKKTDRVDAKKLADRLRRHLLDDDPEHDFPEVWIPDAATEEMRTLFGHYEFVRRQLVATKNRLALVFRRRMIQMPDYTSASIHANRTDQRLRGEDLFELDLGLDRLALLELQRDTIRERIERRAVEIHPSEIRLLVSIPGISVFIAAALMAEIGTIERFHTPKRLASYLCAAPTVDASGSTQRIGGLTKRGRKRAYRFLLQALVHIVSNTTPYAEFLERKRRGKAVCKVRGALVRKTIVAIYFILKNKEVYRFSNDALYARKLREIDRLSSQAA
jgi:transposase